MNMASIFEQSQNLPHIPKVVQELIQSFQNEDVNIDEITSKIAMDQALTAKVLRLANSAHYGSARTISSTNDAIVLLGFNTLRTMVLASGLTSSFKSPEGFDKNAFWKEAFAIAALSKWLAAYVPDCDKDSAFTLGMLHSIGSLLIRMVMPNDAAELDHTAEIGGQRYLLERSRFGFDAAEVGSELAKRWKFPEEMVQGIAEQNNPASDKKYSVMAGVLYIAKYLAHAHQENWNDDRIIEDFPLDVAEVIGMNTTKAYEDVSTTTELSSGLDSLLD